MGETQGTIHPEANCSPAVNLWTRTGYILPKYNGGTRQTFPSQKGEIGKKEGVTGPEQVQDPTGKTPLALKAWEHSAAHTGAGVLPLQLCWTGVQHLMFWVALPHRSTGHCPCGGFLQGPCPCSGSLSGPCSCRLGSQAVALLGWGSEPMALPGNLRNLGGEAMPPWFVYSVCRPQMVL